MAKHPKSRIPQKYRPLLTGALSVKPRGPTSQRKPQYLSRTPISELRRKHKRFAQRNDQVGCPPRLCPSDLWQVIMDAAGVDKPTAKRIYAAITQQMVAAVRDPDPYVCLRDLGTFFKRKHKYGVGGVDPAGKRIPRRLGIVGTKVDFYPHISWHAGWMPVLAYSDAGHPIGIYNGPKEILPWGHPDNPYPTADDVPLEPERFWQASTPLPDSGANPSKKPRRYPEWDVDRDPLLTRAPQASDTRRRKQS